MDFITGFVAVSSGGRHGNALLAPNTLSQYGDIIALFGHLAYHPWMQTVLAELPDEHRQLLKIFFITTTRVQTGVLYVPHHIDGLVSFF